MPNRKPVWKNNQKPEKFTIQIWQSQAGKKWLWSAKKEDSQFTPTLLILYTQIYI